MDIIVENDNLVRIDKYIAENTDYSRSIITKMIEEGYILVNGSSIKPSYKVKLNDCITIKDGFIKSNDVVAQKIDFTIVYEDEHLMVIDKPSGLVVHPGNGNYDNTLVNGLKYYTDELSDTLGDERVGIVHRLDKDTSGLMLVAKSNEAHVKLSEMFKEKTIYREYYALLIGQFKGTSAFIDAPIGRSKTNFNKMEVCANGKSARTNLKVLKKYPNHTLVSLVLETGRTHQIRVHCEYIGYPIYNDPVYQNKPTTEFGQFLHSKKIRFNHPISNKVMEFESSLPKEFSDYLDYLDTLVD